MESPKSARSIWVVAGVAALLIVFVLQLTLAARQNSITWDEDDHIYAGYLQWKNADFGLNPEHPPLVKMLAAVPLLNLPLKVPELQNRNFKIEAFLGGKDFLFHNDADAILWRARMAPTLFTLLLVVLVFLATREMFGLGAAFIALGVLAFDPNLLAHGGVVATDGALSCFMVGSVYAFYRYVRVPTAWRLVVVGTATGLGLAAKHTGILIFPMLFLLALCEVLRTRATENQSVGDVRRNRAVQMAFALVVVSVVSVTILWASYGFRYAARPAGCARCPCHRRPYAASGYGAAVRPSGHSQKR